jgi:hypothetical protein
MSLCAPIRTGETVDALFGRLAVELFVVRLRVDAGMWKTPSR